MQHHHQKLRRLMYVRKILITVSILMEIQSNKIVHGWMQFLIVIPNMIVFSYENFISMVKIKFMNKIFDIQ